MKIIKLSDISNRIKAENKIIYTASKKLKEKEFLIDLKNNMNTVSLIVKLENGFEVELLSLNNSIDVVITKFKSKEIQDFYSCFNEGQLKGWKTISEIIEWIEKLDKV